MQTQLNNQNEKKYQRIMKILNRIGIILNLCEIFYLIVGWLWGKAVRTGLKDCFRRQNNKQNH
jgi:hypothetical protein